MTTGLIAVAVFIVAFVAVSLYWRHASRQRNVPCPTWLAWSLETDWKGRPIGRGRAVQQLELQPGMRVADVGCGPGRLTLPIADAVGLDGEVVALDLQQGMLDKMKRRVAAAGLSNVRDVLGGAGDGLLPKSYFDRVILSTVLGEIPDRERALREIHDALKPGGFLLVVEVIGDPHYQFVKKVRQLALASGLEPREMQGGWFGYSIRLYRPA